jgi:hypothetical protein
MEENIFDDKGSGLNFSYLKCDLCKRNVDKTSQESNFTAFVSGYKQEDDVLVIFDCSRNPYFNHVYHTGCLKTFIAEEMRKDKRTGSTVLKDSELIKHFRCPECYQQKQSIDEEKQKMSMMRASNKGSKDKLPGKLG